MSLFFSLQPLPPSPFPPGLSGTSGQHAARQNKKRLNIPISHVFTAISKKNLKFIFPTYSPHIFYDRRAAVGDFRPATDSAGKNQLPLQKNGFLT